MSLRKKQTKAKQREKRKRFLDKKKLHEKQEKAKYNRGREKGYAGETNARYILEYNGIWAIRNAGSIGIEDLNAVYQGRHIIVQVKNRITGRKSITDQEMELLVSKTRLTGSIGWYMFNENRKWYVHDVILGKDIELISKIPQEWREARSRVILKQKEYSRAKDYYMSHKTWLEWMSKQKCSIDLTVLYGSFIQIPCLNMTTRA